MQNQVRVFDSCAVRAIRAGALGYINQASPPSELVAALRAVAAGRRFMKPEMADSLASHVDVSSQRHPHEELSNHEYEVMCLIAQGKSISEIADSLASSVKTVSTHRTRILEKLGLRHKGEITRYAMQNHLVE